MRHVYVELEQAQGIAKFNEEGFGLLMGPDETRQLYVAWDAADRRCLAEVGSLALCRDGRARVVKRSAVPLRTNRDRSGFHVELPRGRGVGWRETVAAANDVLSEPSEFHRWLLDTDPSYDLPAFEEAGGQVVRLSMSK